MKLTLAEVLEAEDLELGTSSWFPIDQDRIDRFAEATEDRQWIHVDVERAKEGEFGTTIAHGFLILSLLPKLFFEVVELTDMGRMINYGIDKVRFLSPVPSGGEVHLKVRLLSGRRRSGGVMMRIRGDIYLRENNRRALVTEMLFLAFPKE
jgi:acyl dehydratase